VSKALGYVGAGALTLAGLWLMSQPGSGGPRVEDVALPSDEVLDLEAGLLAVREKVNANPELLTAADWLKLREPLSTYFDTVEVFIMESMLHVAADAVTIARGENGHHLTDAQVRAQALAALEKTYEEAVPGWLDQIAPWFAGLGILGVALSAPDIAVQQELLRQFQPVWDTYHEARARIEAIFEELEELPPDTTDPRVVVTIPATPFTSEILLDEITPMEILFAEGGRSSSYGLWWDGKIAADMAAQLTAVSSDLPGDLLGYVLETTAEWAVVVMAEMLGIMLEVVGVSDENIEKAKELLTSNPNMALGAMLVAAGGVVAFQTARTP